MDYTDLDISEIIQKLDTLKADSKPQWGEMSAQRMVEHLTDTIKIASGKVKFPLVVPEDKIEKMIGFLDSDKPMARNIEVSFAKKTEDLRNEEIELAIDDSEDPNRTELHPYYGNLNYEQWCKLNAKHLKHHFEQFGIEA